MRVEPGEFSRETVRSQGMRILFTLLSLSALTWGQSSSAPAANPARVPPAAAENPNVVVIPAIAR
jgi:hypothetical protein